jgi:predicted ATPase
MVQKRTQALLSLADEYGFGLWRASGKFMHGWVLAAGGSVDEGIGLIREGISLTKETGNPGRCYALALLAEAHEKAGQIDKGLHALNEASQVIAATGERNWEAEVCRLKGELLLRQGEAEGEAEACFRQALDVTRRQEAKSLELRATVSLSRLWRRQGKEKEGRTLLKGVYDWFTEGFDTVDLQEAKALIDELA